MSLSSVEAQPAAMPRSISIVTALRRFAAGEIITIRVRRSSGAGLSEFRIPYCKWMATGLNVVQPPCPLCHTVLAGFQREIEQDMGEKLDIPVLHLPQL